MFRALLSIILEIVRDRGIGDYKKVMGVLFIVNAPPPTLKPKP